MKHRYRWLAGSAAIIATLAVSACGSSKNNSSDAGAGSSKSASAGTGTGPCANQPAAKAGDKLAPKPLAEKATVTLAAPAALTASAPVLAADFYCEFARENLTLKYTVVAPPNNLIAVSQGKADVTYQGVVASWLNLVASGSELKGIIPLQRPAASAKEGLWVSKKLLGDDSKFQSADLKGQTIYTVSGPGTPLYWALGALAKLDPKGPPLSYEDFKIGVFPSADMPQALKNGSIKAAIVNQPYAKQLANDPCCEFVADQALTLGYWVAGPSLIKDRPEVGTAFVRAVLRTIRDHLQGNWTSDAALVDSLAKALNQPSAAILGTPPTNFGPGDPAGELKFWDDGVLNPTQQEYFNKTKLLGTTFLTYTKPLTNNDIYDKSFINQLAK